MSVEHLPVHPILDYAGLFALRGTPAEIRAELQRINREDCDRAQAQWDAFFDNLDTGADAH